MGLVKTGLPPRGGLAHDFKELLALQLCVAPSTLSSTPMPRKSAMKRKLAHASAAAANQGGSHSVCVRGEAAPASAAAVVTASTQPTGSVPAINKRRHARAVERDRIFALSLEVERLPVRQARTPWRAPPQNATAPERESSSEDSECSETPSDDSSASGSEDDLDSGRSRPGENRVPSPALHVSPSEAEPQRKGTPTVLKVGATPVTARVGNPGDPAGGFVLGAIFDAIRSEDLAAMGSAMMWSPAISSNGMCNNWASATYMHALVSDEEALHDAAVGHKALRFVRGAIPPGLKAAMAEAQAFAFQHAGFPPPCPDEPNSVMGRIYRCDGSMTHPSHIDDLRTDKSNPLQTGSGRYLVNSPVIILATGHAPVTFEVSQTVYATSNKHGPHVLMKFPISEGCHLIAMLGPGALQIRHEVRVGSARGEARLLPRIAFIARHMSRDGLMTGVTRPDSSGTMLERLAARAKPIATMFSEAICQDISTGVFGAGDARIWQLLRPVNSDAPGIPKSPPAGDWMATLNGSTTLIGDGSPGTELSPQPELLRYWGWHSANLGLSLGAQLLPGEIYVATSLVLKFTKWEKKGNLISSLSRYPNSLALGAFSTPTSLVLSGPDGKRAGTFDRALSQACARQSPVRVLIKHCPKGKCGLLPWISAGVLRHPKMAKGNSCAHFLGMGRVVDSTSWGMMPQAGDAVHRYRVVMS